MEWLHKLTIVVKVFIWRDIVANLVVGLPSSKQGEPWPKVQLHCIILDPHVWGGDISDLIAVVNILGWGWDDGLEGSEDE